MGCLQGTGCASETMVNALSGHFLLLLFGWLAWSLIHHLHYGHFLWCYLFLVGPLWAGVMMPLSNDVANVWEWRQVFRIAGWLGGRTGQDEVSVLVC